MEANPCKNGVLWLVYLKKTTIARSAVAFKGTVLCAVPATGLTLIRGVAGRFVSMHIRCPKIGQKSIKLRPRNLGNIWSNIMVPRGFKIIGNIRGSKNLTKKEIILRQHSYQEIIFYRQLSNHTLFGIGSFSKKGKK